MGLDADPASQGKTIGGSAVEGATPLYEIVKDRPTGDITHERTGQITPPKFPFEVKKVSVSKAVASPKDVTVTKTDKPAEPVPSESRREELTDWLTSANNPYFARSYVNRIWGYLFGTGLMEPIDTLLKRGRQG